MGFRHRMRKRASIVFDVRSGKRNPMPVTLLLRRRQDPWADIMQTPSAVRRQTITYSRLLRNVSPLFYTWHITHSTSSDRGSAWYGATRHETAEWTDPLRDSPVNIAEYTPLVS
ncbi:hypothetical protein BD310DRAFT_394273 [Dichomitus squalens]|uniref:Uncharacterized protein n=1 Tax=Dichomitus squalens TaxID=114155 RepID=A0A4Q9QCD5_9APHY|nr:hypothetical protein BD310DRAFT_394273 [Dichomitus squalens]